VTADRKWNPRYVRYAEAHGLTPGEQLAHDDGTMCEFVVWNVGMLARWRNQLPREYGSLCGVARGHSVYVDGRDEKGRGCLPAIVDLCTPEAHAAYNEWLAEATDGRVLASNVQEVTT